MKPTIEYLDFEKLDLRVGEVMAVELPDWSNKLVQLTVDFGVEIGQKTILSGIKKWYTEEDFLHKKFPFVVNLAERKMGQAVSQGMMVMADVGSEDPDAKPVICPLPAEIPVGSVIR